MSNSNDDIGRETYRQDDVDSVHEDQDQVSNAGVVVVVAARHKTNSDDVVRKHLPVVLAAFFDVDNNDLLQPESPLSEHVELDKPTNLTVGPVRPQLGEVQPVRRVAVDVLYLGVSICFGIDPAREIACVIVRESNLRSHNSRKQCSREASRLAPRIGSHLSAWQYPSASPQEQAHTP